jgi:antitoxin VapB
MGLTYILVGYTEMRNMKMARSTVFTTNRSQAVRIPKSLALPKTVRLVEVTRLGRSRVITPADQSWDAFFDGPAASKDFMAARRQPRATKRETF